MLPRPSTNRRRLVNLKPDAMIRLNWATYQKSSRVFKPDPVAMTTMLSLRSTDPFSQRRGIAANAAALDGSRSMPSVFASLRIALRISESETFIAIPRDSRRLPRIHLPASGLGIFNPLAMVLGDFHSSTSYGVDDVVGASPAELLADLQGHGSLAIMAERCDEGRSVVLSVFFCRFGCVESRVRDGPWN